MSVTTNAGAKVYFCSTAQPTLPLDQEDFEALVWIQVGKVGNLGDLGATTNIVNYDTLDTDVTQKAKGITDAGTFEIEVGRVYNDAGQVALRAAGLTKFNYAVKVELADAPSADYTNTIIYNCGVVTGPTLPGGGNEDFVRETYSFGFNQRGVTVNPALIPSPSSP